VTFAWERVKADPGTILATVIVGMVLVWVVGIVMSFIGSVVGGIGAATTHRSSSGFPFELMPLSIGMLSVSWAINLVVSSFIVAGIMSFALKVAKGVPYTFADLFGGAPIFVSVLVANLVSGLAVSIGLVFLIVPGVILMIGLSMTLPLIVDRGLGPIDALTESWRLTDGNRGNIFIFGLIAFGLAVAGACACGIGIFLVIPLLYIAHMYIYLKLTNQPVAVIIQARPQSVAY
jgi:uncharacterized membrane protein